MLYKDTDGDDRADTSEIVLSGFDDHDTHHAHSAYTADPSGAIYMGEGVFLHTNVETSYGPVRATNGGFYRYNPQRRHLERTAQLSIPNPWGIAFDEWGQNFFAETSGPDVLWMMPGTVKPRYGVATPKSRNLIEADHLVRPTSGLEFVSSRHFPDEVQGDFLINNTIGFLGTKQHTLEDDGTGYTSRHRLDLVRGEDRNFRPVDMEFAPDGSLYMVDWHNVLIGHMQHNARDPLRDHVHGRIYRITYPSRPLVEPANVAGATIEELFENLKLPEFRTRERTRLELRGRDAPDVLPYLNDWVENLDESEERVEHHLLEALWVSWGLNRVEDSLLRQLLIADDYRVRAAAVRVLRYSGHQVEDQVDLLVQAAGDDHGRVRLEAIVAASWLSQEDGLSILNEAANYPLDDWMRPSYDTALARLLGETVQEETPEEIETSLTGTERELFMKGREIYSLDGYCGTCHQPDGNGLTAAGFPPLAETRWVNGNEERLIKLTLNGLSGPIEVLGREYPGNVPMTPFGGMLNNEEVAAVLTYVRNAFGNEASAITPEKVEEVRVATSNKSGFYSAEELLELHPFEE
jgi:mono/diheme cytochrome c family protein